MQSSEQDPRRRAVAVFTLLLPVLVATAAMAEAAASDEVSPYQAQNFVAEVLKEWSFDDGPQGWAALHQSQVSAAGGILKVVSTGNDPYIAAPAGASGPGLVFRMRARSGTRGIGEIFWTTDRHPDTAAERSERFKMVHDGEWRDYEVFLEVDGSLTSLRLDPGWAPGEVEIDWIRIHRGGRHPLSIERIEARPAGVELLIRNAGDAPVDFSLGAKSYRAEARGAVEITKEAPGIVPVEAVKVTIEPRGFPPIRRSAIVFRPEATADSVDLKSGRLRVAVFRDGSGARVERGGALVAALAPLVLVPGPDGSPDVPKLTLSASSECSAEFEGEGGIRAALKLEGEEVSVKIRSGSEVEGPVLRAFGGLEQGLFAGLEYLGKGERSSSTLDIETPEHLRFAPDPLKVTMPLMSCLTDRGMAAITWKDMALQPVFATPNFLDAARDHRMALRGKAIEATILLKEANLEQAGPDGAGLAMPELEHTILWAIERFGGLPSPPAAPRTPAHQLAHCLKGIDGPISGPGGWGHCAEPSYQRHPFADVASTVWRITGKVPELAGPLVPNGAHVPNDAIYFVTGNAGLWLEQRRGEMRGHIAQQEPDGSYVYRGPFRKGHFEDTASGICALPALRLLDFAWLTGDRASLDAGLKTLEYMKRFRTPRGAQTWELSLHTPDVLASAYLVWAYTRGHELTGRKEYLELARKWALSGLPFVYLWSRYPVMLYATPPVYGATHYKGPNWMGLPVQWCGLVYAYALTHLAPHEKTLDWNVVAKGILIAAQQMQYPDGPLVGCLPDVFELETQSRSGPSINPCAIVSIQLVLEGKVASLAVASGGGHRVAAPFPVAIHGKTAHIQGRSGAKYQVLVDGERIVDVKSRGEDEVPLE